MEKDCYQEIIEEVSKKLANKVISEERNLVERSTLIDGDIAGIVQSIGQPFQGINYSTIH